MELRVLKYFLEVSRTLNVTRAAEALHVSQPTLSKQLKDLEWELGKKLFARSNYSIKLTQEGLLLKERAAEILSMVAKTEGEIRALDEDESGDIFIGMGESHLVSQIARVVKKFRENHPRFHFHIVSGVTDELVARLDKGLLDFALICETPDLSRYNFVELRGNDVWGAIARRDSALAKKTQITVQDLREQEIMCSAQSIVRDIPRWCEGAADELHFCGTYTLAYNAAAFVKAGLGCMLAFDQLIDTSETSELTFIPLSPRLETKMHLIWKKHKTFSPIAAKFLAELKTMIES